MGRLGEVFDGVLKLRLSPKAGPKSRSSLAQSYSRGSREDATSVALQTVSDEFSTLRADLLLCGREMRTCV